MRRPRLNSVHLIQRLTGNNVRQPDYAALPGISVDWNYLYGLPEMLERAECRGAGLFHVRFQQEGVGALPFDPSPMASIFGMRHCSLKPEKAPKSFWMSSMIRRMAGTPGLIASRHIKLKFGRTLTDKQTKRLFTVKTLYDQQKYLYDDHCRTVSERIVSPPFLQLIVRGKAENPVKFGAKPDISGVNGWSGLEYCSFDACNEAGNLQEMAERYAKESYQNNSSRSMPGPYSHAGERTAENECFQMYGNTEGKEQFDDI